MTTFPHTHIFSEGGLQIQFWENGFRVLPKLVYWSIYSLDGLNQIIGRREAFSPSFGSYTAQIPSLLSYPGSYRIRWEFYSNCGCLMKVERTFGIDESGYVKDLSFPDGLMFVPGYKFEINDLFIVISDEFGNKINPPSVSYIIRSQSTVFTQGFASQSSSGVYYVSGFAPVISGSYEVEFSYSINSSPLQSKIVFFSVTGNNQNVTKCGCYCCHLM